MKQDRPLSYSALKAFKKSPNHLLAYWDRTLEKTPAMIKGSLIHTLVLEPDTFNEKYAIFEGKTKRGKAYDEFVAQNEGKEIITTSQYLEVVEIKEKVWNDPIAKELFDKTTEVEIEFTDAIQGFQTKGFVDGKGDEFIFDLKTCASAEPEKFSRDAFNLEYHLQAFMYLHKFDVKDYYIIAVETAEPYNVTVFKMTDDMIQAGKELCSELLDKYEAWNGNPVGYSEIIQPLDIPSWAKKQQTQFINTF
jgi:exodeoxyribonuclease VIII